MIQLNQSLKFLKGKDIFNFCLDERRAYNIYTSGALVMVRGPGLPKYSVLVSPWPRGWGSHIPFPYKIITQ